MLENIPVILVAGGDDKTVPLCENGELLAVRFRKAGGKLRMIVKPDCDQHPHALEDPAPVVAFLKGKD